MDNPGDHRCSGKKCFLTQKCKQNNYETIYSPCFESLDLCSVLVWASLLTLRLTIPLLLLALARDSIKTIDNTFWFD